jgi:aspartyl protease family protein
MCGCAAGVPGAALAVDVDVVALIKGKATLVIDGHPPRTLAIGQVSPEGVKLLAADSQQATVEIDGKQETIAAGARATVVATIVDRPRKVTLYPDARGHFTTIGSVNSVPVRFMVDSGATAVVLSVGEAQRARVDYLHAERGVSMTANGAIGVYRVKLPSVKVGELELRDVDANIIDSAMPESLLGMSFLSRVEMQRNGEYMTLAQHAPEGSAGKAGNANAPASNLPGHAQVVMNERGGHFYSNGSINGVAVGFTIDTGASLVSISMADAKRMGINYLNGQRSWSSTANGRAPVYLLKFDEVKVGDIVLHNIDGAVMEGDSLSTALLGMSFLNRMEILRDGKSMTLTQRF